jgi:hypothetical protein
MKPVWMKTRVLLPALMLAASAVAAPPLSDYASQWPLAATDEGAYALALREDVYRELVRDDLRDLAAFNADGQPLAFGPMPASHAPQPSEWREAVWFALPASGDAPAIPGEQLHLHVRRTTSGELSLDASLGTTPVEATAPAAARDVRDLLVDVRAPGFAVEALEFEARGDAGDFNLQVAVEASEDLEHWRSVVASASLARLHQSGHLLSRKRVAFPGLETAYLRVRTLSSQPLPLASLRLQVRSLGPRPKIPALQWTAAEPAGRDGNDYLYRLPGRLPAEEANVLLAGDNQLAEVTLSVRDDESQPWRFIGGLGVFRLRGAGVSLDNESLAIGRERARFWRLSVAGGQMLAQAPELRLGWRPETWLLLTHGRAPYVVVAGSQRAQRQDMPLDALVAQVRSKYGPGWQPALTGLGPGRVAGGETALTAYDPGRKRTWLLWGILLLGAVGVSAMVLHLLRSPPADKA